MRWNHDSSGYGKIDDSAEEDNKSEEMKETADQEQIEEINTNDPHPTKLWAMKQFIDEK